MLLNWFSWSSVFFLNVPVAIIGVIGCLAVVPESFSKEAPKPDFPGVTLSIIGMVALVYGMIRAGEDSWLAIDVWISFAVAAVFITLFLLWQKRSPHPMLPLEFFKIKTFSGASIALSISSFAMMGSMYFFSQFFQSVQGYKPDHPLALCMLPMTPATLYFTMRSVKVIRRRGTRVTMTLGLLSSALGLMLFSLFVTINTPYLIMVLILLVMGMGAGCHEPRHQLDHEFPSCRTCRIGSAMNDTTREVGGTLGVACLLGSLMNSQYRATVDSLTPPSAALQRI